jgi:hypothetical protein
MSHVLDMVEDTNHPTVGVADWGVDGKPALAQEGRCRRPRESAAEIGIYAK